LQDQLTARFERVLEVEIARAMGEMIAQYEVTRATPALPVEHEARMAEIWAQMANVSIRAFGGRVLDQGKASGRILETKSFAELFARLSLEYITSEMIRARITMVSETLRSQIVNVIGAGQAAGSTLPEISKQLRTLSRSIPRFRADMIARTEVHGAANYGADEAAKATGLTLRKEWVAAGDGRTRDEHADMDGEVVDMDQSFNFGSYRLMYPGDRSGPARGVINCRCQIAHVVDDEFDVD
jgi:uncharacterized protein with gpF-like domain